MRVDFYTYNKRIADYLEEHLGNAVIEEDNSEPDQPTLLIIREIEDEEIPKSKLEDFVDKEKEKGLEEAGGWETRDTKTGEVLDFSQSYAERMARSRII